MAPLATERRNSDDSAFRFSDARSLIRGLGQPDSTRYWLDFTVTIGLGHATFMASLLANKIFPADASAVWALRLLLYPVTVVLYMRCAMFIHELAHIGDKMPWFRWFWNVTCGCPFLTPSFMYLPHLDHHRRKSYGTKDDGEYLPLAHMSRWVIVGFVAQSLILPILGYVRFMLISPLCWCVPSARRWVHEHASTMLVDPTYLRRPATPEVMKMIIRQEGACFVWLLYFTFGHYLITGNLFNPLWVLGYCVAVGMITLNAVRTLGAHRWNGMGQVLSFEEQLLDSVNYPNRSWITELWGPVGTRYHALHHLFPSLPYHDLPEAHRRLAEGLPPDSPYHQTSRTSLIAEIVFLWNQAGRSQSRLDGEAA